MVDRPLCLSPPCNILEPPAECTQIRRYNADCSAMEVLARGVRNTLGFDFHPMTCEPWFTAHGRERLGNGTPHDEPSGMSATGLNFGFPHCHEMGVPVADVK